MTHKKWFYICYLVIIVGSIGYWITNNYQFFEAHVMQKMYIDEIIPFIIWTIPFYLLIFPAIILIPFFVNSKVMYQRAVFSSLLLATLTFIIFVFFPTKIIERQQIMPIIEQSKFWQPWYTIVYLLDTNYNCFPSFHVSMGIMSALIFYRERPKISLLYFIIAILVAVSTLTTKQHYFVDVVGGTSTALISYLFIIHWFLIKK